MTELTFTTENHYRFARSFFINDGSHNPAWDFATLTATFSDPVISRLFNRINTEEAVILPLLGGKEDHWLITARTSTEIDQMMSRVKAFLYPTFVRFGDPRWQAFASKSTELCRYGRILYDRGYYKLDSARAQRPQILAQLDLWMSLENARPPLAKLVRPTYRGIITEFEYALVAEDWKGAAELILTAHKEHLTTAENIIFLEYRLLAKQDQWATIFRDDQYEYLVQISVPRKVKEIMLQAFYEQRIANREKVSWEEGHKAFTNEIITVGNLLAARSGLKSESVLKLFAYQAVTQRDAELLRELIGEASGVLKEQLEQIGRLLHEPIPVEPFPAGLSLFEQANLQLREKRYDQAWKLAKRIETRKQRTITLLLISTSCHDSDREEIAYGEYRKCSKKHQSDIVADVPYLKYFLNAQERSYRKHEMDAAQALNAETLVDWFSAVKKDPSHPALGDTLEQLLSQEDAEHYEPSQLELLYTMLIEFSESNLRSKSYVKTFVKKLATRLIDDEQFPRDNSAYIDLYEGVFESLMALNRNERNFKILLRLLEGILQSKPEKRDAYYDEFRKYITYYIPAFYPLLQELFEVFTAHGIKSEKLNHWLNEVLEELLQQRTLPNRYSLDVWEELATWAHCRPDLRSKLKELQITEDDSEDESPMARLEKGFKILIFMLNEKTAQRVKNYILHLNRDVDVDIYSQKSPNADVIRAAPNADMIVMVTACIKHAISYAIEPITNIENRVYPGKSQGSSAIINAIEEHIRPILGSAS